MAEYRFTAGDFSLTTTWNRVRVGTSQGENITTTGLAGQSVKTSFSITGISLTNGERIKSVILSANISRSGTTDHSEIITVNGLPFSGTKKLDAASMELNSNYDVTFYFRASGNAPAIPTAYGTSSYSCTLYCSNVTLTVITGTGSVFDGEISSLNEGDKILVTEEGGDVLYTLVHHEYNTGKALIFRDNIITGTSSWRWTVPSSAYSNSYENSTLDQYFVNTWYPTLPAATTQFLQMITYPVRSSAGSGSDEATIDRMACTLSAMESGQGGTNGYGTPWNYTDTLAYSGSYTYWTREPVSGMAEYAKSINTSGTLRSDGVKTSLAMRPTLGVLEEQLVRYSDSDGGYIFCTKCTAPSTLYINGVESNVVDLNREANLTLSWNAGTAGHNAEITGYAVWYSTSENGTYELYGTTTDTSMIVLGPAKNRQVYYFKVQTLGPEDADYCDSELSTTYRSAATKEGNVSYYDGTKWLLAAVKYYNGSTWVDVPDIKYYDGSKWV